MEVTGETAEEAKERSIEQTNRVDTLIRESPQPSEVVDARGNHPILRDRLNSTDQLLADTDVQISDLGLSASAFGVVGNEITDDSLALQDLVDSAEGRIINLKTNGKYKITSTLELNSQTKIKANGAQLIIQANVDGVIIPKNAEVSDLKIKSGIVGYSKSLILLDGQSGFDVSATGSIDNIILEGDSAYLANGISAIDNGVRSVVAYFKGENISFIRLNHGILFENEHPSSWYNGNNFDGLNMYDCKHFITLDGVVDGNVFDNMQIQPSGRTETALKCNGNNNHFGITLWDTVAYPNLIPYDFEGGSRNKIHTNNNLISLNANQVQGSNPSNEFNGSASSGLVYPKPKERAAYRTKSNTVYNAYLNYLGEQDNILSMAHKIYTISSTGISPQPSFHNAFSLDNKNAPIVFPEAGEIVIKIDTSADVINHPEVLGILFAHESTPDYVKIETENTGGRSLWRESGSVNPCEYGVGVVGNSITAIYITLRTKTAKTVRVARIFMSSGNNKQRTFIQTDGGSIYEDLIFEEAKKGVVVSTPDGTKKYRIGIDNEGVLTTTIVT